MGGAKRGDPARQPHMGSHTDLRPACVRAVFGFCFPCFCLCDGIGNEFILFAFFQSLKS